MDEIASFTANLSAQAAGGYAKPHGTLFSFLSFRSRRVRRSPSDESAGGTIKRDELDAVAANAAKTASSSLA